LRSDREEHAERLPIAPSLTARITIRRITIRGLLYVTSAVTSDITNTKVLHQSVLFKDLQHLTYHEMNIRWIEWIPSLLQMNFQYVIFITRLFVTRVSRLNDCVIFRVINFKVMVKLHLNWKFKVQHVIYLMQALLKK